MTDNFLTRVCCNLQKLKKIKEGSKSAAGCSFIYMVVLSLSTFIVCKALFDALLRWLGIIHLNLLAQTSVSSLSRVAYALQIRLPNRS